MAVTTVFFYQRVVLLLFTTCCLTWSFTLPNHRASRGSSLYVDVDDSSVKKSNDQEESPLRVVVVGGGWAGFSAADALASSSHDGSNAADIKIDLLDASPRGPGGLAGGWRTPVLNRPVEPGLHGFWRDYRNTFAAIERIDALKGKLDDILTPYTPSMLVSESGKVAVAPVLGQDGLETKSKALAKLPEPLQQIVKLLPPPLDIALLSDFDSATPLTILDRISAIGLLGAWADFIQDDPESWKRYDGISAEQLFLSTAGVTPTMYRELVTPLLHVLPMTPGYDCSAAAALSCFHVFALQSKGAFDVRWCRGSIGERIFNPWSEQLQEKGGVNIRGSSRVTAIVEQQEKGKKKYKVTVNEDETIECDAIVMAVGGTAMKRLVPSCPLLENHTNKNNDNKKINWNSLRGVTCVAVRLFLKPSKQITADLKGGMHPSTELPKDMAKAMEESPVIVCGPRVLKKELAETGFCIYDLQRLHDEFQVSSDNESTAAIEVDFFRADYLANLETDEEVVKITLDAVAAALGVSAMKMEDVLDSSVVRARNAVSHFCVDSAAASPDVKLGQGLYMCGDWIDRSGHASWSTEKAVVTGRQAVGALAQDFGLANQLQTDVIPVPLDSAQLTALRQVAKTLRNSPLLPTGLVPVAPWKFFQQLRGGNY